MKILCCLLITWALSAAPIGNSASPALLQEGMFIPDTTWCQPRAALIADFVVEKKLVGSRHLANINAAAMDGILSLGSASWSIRERFDLSVIAGSGEQTLRFSLQDQHYKAHVKNGLVWYGEAKLIVFEVKNTTLSGFGEVGGWDWMSGPFRANDVSLSSDAQLMMRFWTVGAELSQKFGWLNLYGGVAVMRSRWKLNHTDVGNYLFHQKYPVGPLFGFSLSNTSAFLFNVEWRGWIENACSLTGEMRF